MVIDKETPIAEEDLRVLDIYQVVDVLRDLFGYNSTIALNFIRKVVAEPDERKCATLGINARGTLFYNPAFFTRHINTERKLKEVIFHELLHPVLGDMNRRFSFISNLASDIIINVIIGKTLGHNDLFKEMYADKILAEGEDVSGLLRPGTKVLADGQKFLNLYHSMWGWAESDKLTTVYDPRSNSMKFQDTEYGSIEEIREILEILLSTHPAPTILLIGSHGHTFNDMGGQAIAIDPTVDGVDGDFEGISNELKEILAKEIADTISTSAGYSDSLMQMAVETIRANVTLVKSLLDNFTANTEFNSFIRYYVKKSPRRLIFPKKISRKDLVSLATGNIPLFWDSPKSRRIPKKDGISVFVDVSGSQFGELPMIFGFLKAVKNFTEGIYQFSNKVVAIKLKDLWTEKGANVDTTGGTDYDCIVEYCCQENLKKIVVITDGYAGLSEENQNRCRVQVSHACVIYSEHHTTDEFWGKNYHKSYSIHDLFRGAK